MMKRVIAFLILGFILCGCSDILIITDSDIISEGDTYNFRIRKMEISDEQFSIEFKNFKGVQTVWLIDSYQTNQFLIEYDYTVSKGNFKMVLVTPDEKIINIFEKGNNCIFNTTIGRYRIKIIGFDGSGSLNVNLIINDGLQVSYMDK